MPRSVALAAIALLGACGDQKSPGGGLPTAELSLPSEAMIGVQVEIDASGSRDPEGKLLRFRFDFNDGSPSVVTGAAITHHVFRARGFYPVCVWVTDVEGLTANECREVNVVFAPDRGIPDAPHDAGLDHPLDARGEGQKDLDLGGDGKLDKLKLDQPKDKPKLDQPKDKPKLDQPKDKLKLDQPKDQPKPDKLTPDKLTPDKLTLDKLKLDQPSSDLTACYSPELGGSGAAGYAVKLVAGCHPSIASTGTKLGINKDEVGALAILPFTFSFYGKNAIAAGVSANGYLQFVGASTLTLLEPVPVAIPSSGNPNNMVAAFWDNLAPISPASDVWVGTLGQAPNRIHVIQWQGWTFSGASWPAELEFSILLYEGSNVVELQYTKLDGGARSTGSFASIGIENESGMLGIKHAFQTADAVSTTVGIRFVPK